MTKSQAGQLGGLSTFKKHGKKYMRQIGKRGGERTHELYRICPVGQSHYAMVRRSDNVIISTNIPAWRM